MHVNKTLLPLLLTMFAGSSALQCYICDPSAAGSKGSCGDPFDITLGEVKECSGPAGPGVNLVCTKFIARAINNMSAMAVGRGCSTLGAQSCNKLRDKLTSYGTKLAFCKTCSTDLCNYASTHYFNVVIVLALTSFSFLLW